MNMADIPSWMLTLLGTFGGAFGAYVAIRADLASLKAIAEMHGKSIERAHARIDSIQEHAR
jgi:hypothetical protein